MEKTIKIIFQSARMQYKIEQPFKILNIDKKFDLSISVVGGGNTGQVEAIRLAISRALCDVDSENRTLLKTNGLLTRDSRVVERKNLDKRKRGKNSSGLRDKIINV